MSIPCIICHEIFTSDTDVVAISRCGHIYHGICLDQWKRSSPQKSTCPLCRKTYDKRSLRKLYFNVEEPEINAHLSNDLKRQKVISENLSADNNKLREELRHNRIQTDKINAAWLNASSELNKIQTDYGIKCQAYSIIDTVNNEFLQDNKRLRSEILKLQTELEQMKKAHSNTECRIIDLTQDDDSKVQRLNVNNESKNSRPEYQLRNSEESLATKKFSNEDDYKSLEDFILSQI